MPPHSVSREIKARIPVLHQVHGYKVKEICELLGIRKSLVDKTMYYYHQHGVTFNPDTRCAGRQRTLSSTDLAFIQALLKQKHCLYLDEIQEQLLLQHGVQASVPTIWRTLRRLHLSNKTVSARAIERNDLLRSAFMNRIATKVPDADMFMFIDESAKNERTSGRKKGWATVGKRCVQRRCFVRGQRYSILPVLTLDGIIAHDIIEGSVTADRFLAFLRELVVCASSCVL